MQSNTIEIRKRANIACWKRTLTDACPNTVIELDKGLTALVKIDGVSKVLTTERTVLNGLLHPGKGAKLIGGNKPYARCEIFVFDQSTEFQAEWGLAGSNALACRDFDFGKTRADGSKEGIDCKAVATGSFYYKIEDFLGFANTVDLDDKGEISRDRIREELRAEVCAVAKTCLESYLTSAGLEECRGALLKIADEIKRKVIQILVQKGINVYNFVIEQLDYAPEHRVNRDRRTDIIVETSLSEIENQGKRDDIGVEALRAQNVTIPIMEAEAHKIAAEHGVLADAKKPEPKFCPQCGGKVWESNNFCQHCGAKLK